MATKFLFRNSSVLAFAVCLLLTTNLALRAEEKPEWTPPKPSEQHEVLKQEVGEWDAAVKVWETPDAEPMENKGKETNRMLGDFWLISRFEGEFGGMPFTGGGAFGYDPMEKKYCGIWIDSMSPHKMTFKGDYDKATKTMTNMGEGYDHMASKPCKVKMISKFTDDDNRIMEMHKAGDDGKFWKTMEIKYKRRSE